MAACPTRDWSPTAAQEAASDGNMVLGLVGEILQALLRATSVPGPGAQMEPGQGMDILDHALERFPGGFTGFPPWIHRFIDVMDWKGPFT